MECIAYVLVPAGIIAFTAIQVLDVSSKCCPLEKAQETSLWSIQPVIVHNFFFFEKEQILSTALPWFYFLFFYQ